MLPVSAAEFVSLDNAGSSADHGVPTSSPVSPKLSQNKRRVEKGGRRNTSASKVIGAGNVASNTGDPKGMDASKEGKTGSLNVSSSAELSKGDAGKNLQRLPASPAPRVLIFPFSLLLLFILRLLAR